MNVRDAIARHRRGVPQGRDAVMPLYVPQTAAWFKPNAGVVSAGGAVSSWTDVKSGYSGSQAGAGKPTVATGINGRASLAFASASSQELQNTTQNIVTAGAARYVLAVVKAADADGGPIFTFRLNSTGGAYWALMAHVIGGDRFYFTDGVAINNIESGTGPDLTAPSVIEWEMTVGAKAVVRVNGVARTIVGGNIAAEAGTTGFRIGSRPSAFWNGDIGDIYIASVIPSAGDKAALLKYFAAANGITL